ncbi:MAG: hypothetical protein IPQ07_10980 [Myxococcales bacterium]|nr:hypothetical protein [Myxococcales bacterium]
MASKSGQPDAVDVEELLDYIDKTMERLKTLYEQYFLGMQKQPPSHLHNDIERRIRDIMQIQIRNTGLRYRFATIQQKFGSYNSYWRRTLRQIEQGTYIRQLQRISRKAAQSGEEIPDEILASMPKRMQEQVKRDREQARAIAKRRGGAESEGADAADDAPAQIGESQVVRNAVRKNEHVLGADDGELDIDAFFASVSDDTNPDAMALPDDDDDQEDTGFTAPPKPPPVAARPAAPARPGVPATPQQRPGAPPMPQQRASQPLPSQSQPMPQQRASLPSQSQPMPQQRPSQPLPSQSQPMPAQRPSQPLPSQSQPMPAQRPSQPPPSQSQPMPAQRPSQPPQPPTQSQKFVAPQRAGTVPGVSPNRASGPIPTVPAPGRAPTAPSQVTRPNPIAPGSSQQRPAVPVESMQGPFPRQPPAAPARPTPMPRPEQPPAMRPPPGMNDADVNALYAKYVKAKQAVGEDAGPGAYGKLLKTINSQAPKIMEQYKAKGVEFSVVVKDNQVIIKAKPKP